MSETWRSRERERREAWDVEAGAQLVAAAAETLISSTKELTC